MGAQSYLWLGWILAILWFGTCACTVAWALFDVRATSLRRCPKCWHDLSGIAGLCCSECGRWAKNEQQLHRRKPRRLPAYLALGAALAGALYIHDRVVTDSWMAIIPDRMMSQVACFAPSTGVGERALNEVRIRAVRGVLSRGSLLDLIEHAALGDADAPVHATKWRDRYASILGAAAAHEIINGQPDDESVSDSGEISLALRSIPPRIRCASPSKWFEDDPVVVGLNIDCYWIEPPDFLARVSWDSSSAMQYSGSDQPDAGCVRRAGAAGAAGANIVLGRLPKGSHDGRIIVEVTQVGSRDDESPPIRAEFPAHIQVMPSPIAELPRISGTEVDAAVGAVCRDGLLLWPASPGRAAFRFNIDATASTEFEGVLFGAQILACEAGVVRRSIRTWWMGGPRSAESLHWEIALEDEAALARVPLDGSGWTLRVASMPSIACRSAPAPAPTLPTRIWEGAFEVPLTISPMTGVPQPRPWRVVDDSGPASSKSASGDSARTTGSTVR
ncbi:MAG: hypothetical protein EXS00_04855 [Phycisphaerales bacterium]|nr:hypothetical protein [Phycisphaerales bacterium]